MRFLTGLAVASIALGSAASAQSLSIGDDSLLIGTPIFKNENFTYYNCSDVVKDDQFIESTFKILSKMSAAYGVAPPQNQQCVVSQSFVLGNVISMEYFIDDDNAQCFYRNFCNDTRSATFMPTAGGFEINFMIVNAATKTTAFSCFSPTRGFLTKGCKE